MHIEKRGQVAIYIIIAIVIVSATVIFVVPRVWPDIPILGGTNFQSCIDGKIKPVLNDLEKRGGSLNPSLGINYLGEKREYLCYTNEFYRTCVMQQPMLKAHIERELKTAVEAQILNCVENLKSEMRSKGYNVDSSLAPELKIEIVPRNVKTTLVLNTAFVKDSGERIENVEVFTRSGIYELIEQVNNILNWETTYGDTDIMSFMLYYPNVKVEKLKQDEGSKIYTLTDRTTQEKFVFASRSLSWYPGYGAGEIVI